MDDTGQQRADGGSRLVNMGPNDLAAHARARYDDTPACRHHPGSSRGPRRRTGRAPHHRTRAATSWHGTFWLARHVRGAGQLVVRAALRRARVGRVSDRARARPRRDPGAQLVAVALAPGRDVVARHVVRLHALVTSGYCNRGRVIPGGDNRHVHTRGPAAADQSSAGAAVVAGANANQGSALCPRLAVEAADAVV